ncbi:hypothetical protein ZWY2020_051693 [Hordeum vulgare]|nr:hypothetical protein ZWY2020_051693 [Hordeum vulgare]
MCHEPPQASPAGPRLGQPASAYLAPRRLDRGPLRRPKAFSPEDSRCKKKKAVHKTATTDDKRVQSTLKRVGINTI